MPTATHTTQILIEMSNGTRSAANQLFPLVYEELRALAQRYMAQERPGHTLQATALVHEAYMRLVDQSRIDWKGRAHFFAMAAETIRRILVDHARKRCARKRGGGAPSIRLTESAEAPEADGIEVLAIDEALDELGKLNDRQRKVVELRYFGGLTLDEAAHVLEVSRQTVKADWYMARAWLRERLSR